MTLPAPRVSGFLTPFRDAATSDAELLDRFVAHRDGPAFASLVTRHGPMVFGVCQRVLRDWHAAEDAFQATFLVLARRAASIAPASAVAGWLHGVAYRVAKDARRAELRRNARERQGAELTEPAAPTGPDSDLRAVLDAELEKLPNKYRDLLVACDLEKRPRAPVAAALGIPEGTLSSRLTTARKMLARRLSKRGVAPAITAGIALNGPPVIADEVPRAVRASAARFGSTAGTASCRVSSLAKGVVRAMTYRALQPIAFLLLSTCGALGAALAVADPPPSTQNPGAPGQPRRVTTVSPEIAPPPRAALPLPKGPNRILLHRHSTGLCLLDPDGKNETKIDETDSKFGVSLVQLAPDGKRFAALTFDNQKTGDELPKSHLYVRELDEKGPGTDLGVTPDSYAWSRDGTEIACSDFVYDETGKQRTSTYYIVNVRTKEKTALKLPSGHFITGWSPDGKFFLTCALQAMPDRVVLYLMNRDGTEHKALTGEKELACLGRFSPDGKHVLYAVIPLPLPDKNGERPRPEMAVLDLAAGTTTKVQDVALNAELLDFCWAPDGKQIAYLWRTIVEGDDAKVVPRKETESHLIICDPDGKNQKTVLSEKGTGGGMILSDLDWR